VEQAALVPVLDFLKQHAPFDQLTDADRTWLAQRAELAFFARGEIITDPSQGKAERFYIIKQGRVRGEIEPGGEDGAWELHAGECFPVGALLSHRPVRMAQRAVEDSFCFEFSRDDFIHLYNESAVFRDFCSRRLASMLDRTLGTLQATLRARDSGDGAIHSNLSALIQREPVTCESSTPLREALARMHAARVGSIVVVDAAQAPMGIFTLHDLLARAAEPSFRMDVAIEKVMTTDVVTLEAGASAHDAALVMARESIGHIAVVEGGRLLGVVSERDLFALRRIGLARLSRDIAQAQDIAVLAGLARGIHGLIDQMLARGVAVAQLNQLITQFNDHVTRRVIELVLVKHGGAPVTFTWMSFGSEGRGEQTLKTDQDNGILFAVPKGGNADAVRKTLLPIAKEINDGLAECGYPLCTGNIMASNPECCLTAEEWQARFSRWIDQGTPEHLLKASIFFDFRSLWGDDAPVTALRDWVSNAASDNSRFQRQMAENALRNEPPLGLVRDFVTESGGEHDHTLDLKVRGLTPFVDGARLLALAHGIAETGTVSRIQALVQQGVVKEYEGSAWCDAIAFIQLVRMRHHQQQARNLQGLDNHINPDRLNELDRRILKEAFRQARKLQARIRLDYQL